MEERKEYIDNASGVMVLLMNRYKLTGNITLPFEITVEYGGNINLEGYATGILMRCENVFQPADMCDDGCEDITVDTEIQEEGAIEFHDIELVTGSNIFCCKCNKPLGTGNPEEKHTCGDCSGMFL